METQKIKSKNYNEVESIEESSILTKIAPFDDFLSSKGGFVKGSVILLTGTPGGGKTSLAVFLQGIMKDHITSLYETEMSGYAIVQQTKRLRIDNKNAFISDRSIHATFQSYLL